LTQGCLLLGCVVYATSACVDVSAIVHRAFISGAVISQLVEPSTPRFGAGAYPTNVRGTEASQEHRAKETAAHLVQSKREKYD